jgi:hypothetical protein
LEIVEYASLLSEVARFVFGDLLIDARKPAIERGLRVRHPAVDRHEYGVRMGLGVRLSARRAAPSAGGDPRRFFQWERRRKLDPARRRVLRNGERALNAAVDDQVHRLHGPDFADDAQLDLHFMRAGA